MKSMTYYSGKWGDIGPYDAPKPRDAYGGNVPYSNGRDGLAA